MNRAEGARELISAIHFSKKTDLLLIIATVATAVITLLAATGILTMNQRAMIGTATLAGVFGGYELIRLGLRHSCHCTEKKAIVGPDRLIGQHWNPQTLPLDPEKLDLPVRVGDIVISIGNPNRSNPSIFGKVIDIWPCSFLIQISNNENKVHIRNDIYTFPQELLQTL